jgi:hypothetical protein
MKKRRQCDRDELGRRIPRRNTKSAQIYALKLAGMGNAEIARKLGMKAGAVGVLWYGICHPELKNRRWYDWRLESCYRGPINSVASGDKGEKCED